MGLEQLRPTSTLAAKPVLPAAMHRYCSPAQNSAPGQQRASCGICGRSTRRCAAGGCHPRLTRRLREQGGQESIGGTLAPGWLRQPDSPLDGAGSDSAAGQLRAYRTISGIVLARNRTAHQQPACTPCKRTAHQQPGVTPCNRTAHRTWLSTSQTTEVTVSRHLTKLRNESKAAGRTVYKESRNRRVRRRWCLICTCWPAQAS